MRKPGLFLLLCGSLAIPAAVSSQEPAPAPASPEDFVCAFAGDCADEAAEEETPARAPGAPRITATRGFSLSTPEGASRPAARRPARRPGANQRRAGPSGAARPPAAAHGQRVNLSLAFASGSAKLTGDAVRQARVFGQALMLPQLANMRFRIEGHTDSIGSRAGNLDLSRRRAESVADFLVEMGVPRDRLEVRGYGPDQPLAGTRASEPQNRRVEAVRVS
jgi:outer membrane protein OmpA-like peptidoglycan-associated protein